jgi:D-glycero-D-manno-heptose 1,7-bisphosphate phosphatase
MPAALFLDRDGVLNAKPPEGGYVTSAAELVVLPGVPQALAALRGAVPGLRIAIVTNQRGVALGRMTAQAVAATHERLLAELAAAGGSVDRIEVCPHERDTCDCRKPGTGLLRRALETWPGIDPAACALVGDSASDLVAGRRFGVRTYLVGEDAHRRAEGGLARAQGAPPDEEAASLPALVQDGRLTAWLRDGRIVMPVETPMSAEHSGQTSIAPAALATPEVRS